MPPKKQTRKVLRINQTNLIKYLKIIATHGITEQGSEEAIRIGRDIFYYKKGTEKLPISDEEVGKLIYN